jgi:tetratricopeptide (TPR) repeat protein
MAPIEALYAAGKWLLDAQRPLDAAHVFRGMLVAAPVDERAWLGLGACHEALGQASIAIELYASGASSCASARCHVARARLLRALGRDEEASDAVDAAEEALGSCADEHVVALVAYERRAA